MKQLPVFLNLSARPCLVVGGGRVARRRTASLLECAASVTVVSPSVCPDLAALSPERIHLLRRPYQPTDLDGTFMVVAATDDPTVNQAVIADARARGILVGSVGPAGRADLTFGSVVRQNGLTVSISTGGRSPAFGRWLAEEIGRFLTPEYVALLALAADVRAEQQRAGAAIDPDEWQAGITPELLELIRRGEKTKARARLREILRIPDGHSC